MKFSVPHLLFGSIAAATASGHTLRASSPIDVKIERTGNTLIKATVTNTGSENLRLLKTGSIIDKPSTKKVEAFSNGGHLYLFKLTNANFQDFDSAAVIEATFDLADLYDVSKGGDFTLVAHSGFALGEGDHKIGGYAAYTSNVLDIHVNSTTAEPSRGGKLRLRFEYVHVPRPLVHKWISDPDADDLEGGEGS
ncbi:hypothetical protein PWT90_06878 [Aphanocladium album]|nr:hypothetical protein PWT90_06878 [Aphanocladium album]